MAPDHLPALDKPFLQAFPPFDRMEDYWLEFVIRHARPVSFSAGQTILTPGDGEADTCYIIRSGKVLADHPLQGEDYLEVTAGNFFPLGALLARRPVSGSFKASEETLCYVLQADDFNRLVRESEPFWDYCTHRVASLLEESKAVVRSYFSGGRQHAMNVPIASVLKRQPVTCPPGTPVREALRQMDVQNVGSVVITDAGQRPLGIFTLHDLLRRVNLADMSLDEPIGSVMTVGLDLLSPRQFVYEASMLMARLGVRHVLIADQNRLVGVLSESDLAKLERVGMRQISEAIRRAEDADALLHCARDIRDTAENLLSQGVGAEQLTRTLSTLNDLLTERVIQLELNQSDETVQAMARHNRFCWIALGSEGRFEQTLTSDQDNGIIFTAPDGMADEETRQHLLPVARRINQTLARCGFRLCPGDIMAGNPKWCLSLAEWKHAFAEWILRGSAQELLHATIFFDFRSLFGNAVLATELRESLNDQISANRPFLKKMVENALGNRPPLGLVRDFSTDRHDSKEHTLDLKVNGVTLFVDAARIFALANGLHQTNTAERLRAAGEAWHLDGAQVEAWVNALQHIQTLRLQNQEGEALRGEKLDNYLDPDDLNDLDRKILVESFRQARKMQSTMEKYFQF